jgi:hypothetical protein
LARREDQSSSGYTLSSFRVRPLYLSHLRWIFTGTERAKKLNRNQHTLMQVEDTPACLVCYSSVIEA